LFITVHRFDQRSFIMQSPAHNPAQDLTLLAPAGLGMMERAMGRLRLDGALGLTGALEPYAAMPALVGSPLGLPLGIEMLMAAMGSLDQGCDLDALRGFVEALPREVAAMLHQALRAALDDLGEGRSTGAAPDSLLVMLACLAHAKGGSGAALSMLDRAMGQRTDPRFRTMGWFARCVIMGADHRLATYWVDPIEHADAPSGKPFQDARDRLARHPAQPAAHRAMARTCAEANRWDAALFAFCAALALPAAPQAKQGIGADLAVALVWMVAQGRRDQFVDHHMLTLRLMDHPTVAAEALDLLLKVPASAHWCAVPECWLDDARAIMRRSAPPIASPRRAACPPITR
jgi:hypothetical protein